jgi:hypothetical protein
MVDDAFNRRYMYEAANVLPTRALHLAHQRFHPSGSQFTPTAHFPGQLSSRKQAERQSRLALFCTVVPMAAHPAQVRAQLQKVGQHQAVPATSSVPCIGLRAGRLAGSRLCRKPALPCQPRLTRSSTLAVTASTYENGYGSVGKPEDQAAPLAVDIASLQTVRNPPAGHPLSQPGPYAVQGAAA